MNGSATSGIVVDHQFRALSKVERLGRVEHIDPTHPFNDQALVIAVKPTVEERFACGWIAGMENEGDGGIDGFTAVDRSHGICIGPGVYHFAV